MILLFIVIALAILAVLLLQRMAIPIVIVAVVICIFGWHSFDWLAQVPPQATFAAVLIGGTVVGILLGIAKMKARR
jgi:hypothetical protein